jgi:hypothetical protein
MEEPRQPFIMVDIPYDFYERGWDDLFVCVHSDLDGLQWVGSDSRQELRPCTNKEQDQPAQGSLVMPEVLFHPFKADVLDNWIGYQHHGRLQTLEEPTNSLVLQYILHTVYNPGILLQGQSSTNKPDWSVDKHIQDRR